MMTLRLSLEGKFVLHIFCICKQEQLKIFKNPSPKETYFSLQRAIVIGRPNLVSLCRHMVDFTIGRGLFHRHGR